MKCPVCVDATLVMSERKGIEIDYCPECRGIWLDRGEIDKIIERSVEELAAEAPQQLHHKEHRLNLSHNHNLTLIITIKMITTRESIRKRAFGWNFLINNY